MKRCLFIAISLVALLGVGCARTSRQACPSSATLSPINAYVRHPSLPDSLKRVAVLPLMARSKDGSVDSGVEALEPLLLQQLRERQLFEVVEISRAELKLWTGRSSWSAHEELPADLLARVRAATACQAVLFPQLTRYQPYPPLAVGLSLRLVDCESSADWWAVDEVIDAGEPQVAAAARAYARTELNLPSQNETSVLQSPRRFGSFVAGSLMNTIPGRAVQVF